LLVKPSLVNSFSSPDCIIRIYHKIFFPRSSQVWLGHKLMNLTVPSLDKTENLKRK